MSKKSLFSQHDSDSDSSSNDSFDNWSAFGSLAALGSSDMAGDAAGGAAFDSAPPSFATLGEAPEPSGPAPADPVGASAVSQGATGNPYIDGVLSGSKWNGSFTFSFPQLASQYGAYPTNEPTTNFAPVTFQQREAARAILNGTTFSPTANVEHFGAVNSFISPSVTEAGGLGNGLSGAGDIRLGESTLANPTAYAYYPSNQAAGQGGDVWFGTAYANTVNDYRNPVLGGYSYHTHIHELGHAMGLKHSHETGGPANVAVPTDRDAIEFTVMSYRSYVGGPSSGGYTYETWGGPQTYMMLDIQALQTMYGAYYGSHAGNTVYQWSPTTGEMFVNEAGGGFVAQGTPGGNRVFMTIWDGNGVDTYDMSNYSNNVSIDLTPGSWSITSQTQRAFLGFDGVNNHYANGTVYNALLFNGDARSYIENANGGSGNDTINGNVIANVLNGNAGNDTINGGAGNDTINGGDGNDTIDGGSGVDVMNGGNGDDLFRIFNGWTGGAGEQINGDAGSDTFDTSAASLTTATIDLVAGTFNYTPGGSGFIALSSIENVITGSSADTITGNSSDNTISTNGGNDSINAGPGHDTVHAGDGDDTITDTQGMGASDDDVYDGGNGPTRWSTI